jgi:rhodanese-related sulfurtransferase
MRWDSIIAGFARLRRHALNFFVENWLLILLAFVSGGMLVWPMVQRSSGGGSAVSASEAVRLINREKAVLIDVCEPGEYAAGHAIGARNVPLGQLDAAKALPSNKALPVVLICASGARSARGAAQLRKAGYDKAVTVAGGNAAWRDAQLPMEKSA